ncbi:MAG: hypothetical protein HN383_10450 [Verrucomicrobia bacterium]|jgi:hypothetical protein|nr:hypothetical protein [Verrucomicrobiota bacterium]MBT7700505.1 hypothetical protein [Verrucomicrobiota bacterium]
MTPDDAKKQAFALLATYDRPEATPDELHIVRIASTWISIMRARQSVQGIVNRIMDDFENTDTEEYGCGWDELVKQFTAWAVTQEWLEEDGTVPEKRGR